MTVDHYENFPVASWLLPPSLREPVRDIYRFARSADDIADEGDAAPADRLAALDAYRQALTQLGALTGIRPAAIPQDACGDSIAPGDALPYGDLSAIFTPLQRTIVRHRLPLTPFFDLLSAFSQDVQRTRYPDQAMLLDYCRRSANPVGRLMLHLYDQATPRNEIQSDAICTGLQLTNFWQDVAQDWDKGRVYLAQDSLARHGLGDGDISRYAAGAPVDAAWRALMAEQCAQARTLLQQGLPLAWQLPGRIGLELRVVVQGGLRVLQRLDQAQYDMFRHRPVLGHRDRLLLLWRALASRNPAMP